MWVEDNNKRHKNQEYILGFVKIIVDKQLVTHFTKRSEAFELYGIQV